MIPADKLKRWRELAAAATPGPWRARDAHGLYIAADSLGLCVADMSPDTSSKGWYGRTEDADFIAESRSALPALLDEVERLTAEDTAWSDLCNQQNALLEERYRLTSPQVCGWCMHAAGDTAEARETIEKFTLEEVRAHTQSCPNNPLVAERDRLRAALDYLRRKIDGYDGTLGVAEEIAAGRLGHRG